MEKYDIIEWVDLFEKSGDVFDLKNDVLESRSRILYPGRFYILNYFSKTKDRYNMRPVILSLGISKKDPDSFLCIDLTILPKKIRMAFLKIFFDLYNNDIMKNIVDFMYVADADKQKWFKDFTYDNICKVAYMLPLKFAIKRYKIEKTLKIYSVPFQNVYRVVGDFCDENCYKNGTIRDVQLEFIDKMKKMKR